ncbi:glycoside hydrolase family 76 protein [Cohnella sp. REN36]|uniref:glycoside hydrolase family 76 protein n=1 Tax=Cohnella sp. REN36 TaxID=2887347 RepID=UPI001D15814B|nr:glycoside hydrolase family 76 protein [Cohnella sp. REN36]MCC3376861.1 glycosyl hydrolase [Cohnella sp. REN36]
MRFARRKGWAVAAVAVVLLAAAVWAWRSGTLREAAKPATGSGSAAVWADRADAAQAALESSFWDGKRGLYSNASPCMLQLCTDPFNYWWMAHAADALTDGYQRTGDARYGERLADLYDGLLARNAGVWPNDYYDDMAWMGLAWLRAFDATGEERYKEAALTLWADIRGGWNDEMGGGIAWRKEQTDYKNTPANAPSAILAARLYERFGNAEDLDWAKRIYEWETKTLVDPETGFVWDGINRTGDGEIDKAWQFSYNQGVYIGASVELYRATKEASYLEAARRTASVAAETLAGGPEGLLPSEGDGDGALFKGVFVRYLGELIAEDGDSASWAKLLSANAESLWADGRAPAPEGGESGDATASATARKAGDPAAEAGSKALFGPSWAQPPETVVQLGADISGVTLLEVMTRLERDGRLK